MERRDLTAESSRKTFCKTAPDKMSGAIYYTTYNTYLYAAENRD